MSFETPYRYNHSPRIILVLFNLVALSPQAKKNNCDTNLVDIRPVCNYAKFKDIETAQLQTK